ncbi:MAG: Gfo/Idh/MocA family oxidoreductase [Rhizobiaceae bacterium]|jgi:predicted dehydrogenase|nr:Gfo/Idh/MocA family oxidoreductase [Rhizobiaceae bacterium]
MFRWGILSTAKIGRDHVIPAIAESENGVVAAIASRDLDKAQALAGRFGAPHAFGSYEAMLESDAIDGVYIPLVTSEHVRWAVAAAEAGKHVLVEKPLALNAADIEPLVEAEAKAGVLVSEAFMVTYHPQWEKVRDLVRGGAIGTLMHVQGAFTYNNGDQPDNMRNLAELGGGALPDIGVYPTVTTRFVTGHEPQRVSACVRFENGVDVYSSVRNDFGGFELSYYLSMRMAARQIMVFHGDAGFIEVAEPFNAGLYGDPAVTLWDKGHKRGETFRFGGAKHYREMVEAFVKHVRGKPGKPVFRLADSIANQRAIDAVFRAGRRNDGGWETV